MGRRGGAGAARRADKGARKAGGIAREFSLRGGRIVRDPKAGKLPLRGAGVAVIIESQTNKGRPNVRAAQEGKYVQD